VEEQVVQMILEVVVVQLSFVEVMEPILAVKLLLMKKKKKK